MTAATPQETPRLTAADFDQDLLILFDAYVHGDIDRRMFLDRAKRYAVGGATAAGLLASLSPKFAEAQVIKPDDARVRVERVSYASPAGHGTVNAYLARPASASGPLPGILVVHENRGLNPHIEDIARRLALDGYVALAPDMLTSQGGYPGDEDKARELFGKLDQAKCSEDFVAGAAALRTRPECNGKAGVVGFCYGGAIAHQLSIRAPELLAAVPFYGPAPAPAMAAQVKVPLLIHFAAVDERINAAWPAYEAALKAAGVSHAAHQYPGTQHGFNNDTTPRFDEAAAKLAWSRTLAFFKARLQG